MKELQVQQMFNPLIVPFLRWRISILFILAHFYNLIVHFYMTILVSYSAFDYLLGTST